MDILRERAESTAAPAPMPDESLLARARAHLGTGVKIGQLFVKSRTHRSFLDSLERRERAALENYARDE